MINKLENGKFALTIGGLTVYFNTKKQAQLFMDNNQQTITPTKKRVKKVVSADFTGKNYTLTQFSSNAKLSNNRSFATVSGSHKTCPASCAFIKTSKGANGCYGDNHGIRYHFDAIGNSKGLDLNELKEKLECLPKGQKIRFFDVGDVPNHDEIMDIDVIKTLNDAVRLRKLNPIQYTHNVCNYSNAWIVKKLNYVLNFSCETIQQAKNALDNGVNAVLVVVSNTERVKHRTVDDINLITCPAQWQDLGLSKKEITCADCMLCAKNRVDSKNVIVFYSHGSGYKKIDSALNLINLKG